ncbi:MAG TPA: bifunctional alpha/beta hydrolase/OsmC family protein [Thermohalobaculum sp.]|nr:bifunctional alpha/beta hydrolase/OsmC family protein [Thermohalobaculum sp.]
MQTQKLEFTGHGGDTLAARFDLPDGKPKAVALFAHCFTCGKDIAAARRIAARLAGLGIAVLRFDFTGLGHSKGEFANTHFTSNVADLVAASRHLAGLGQSPSLLIGHSLGGAAVLAAAADIPTVKAIVTIGAPADPGHVIHNFGCKIDEIQAAGQAEVSLAGRPFIIRREFIDDISTARLKPAIAGLKRALLVLHSPVDQTVGIENASEIFLAAKHPKSFVTLDGADHLLSRAEDAEYAADVIAAWSRRYLGLTDNPTPKGAPEGIVRVAEADPAGFLQDVMAGPKHHILADEPTAYGGTDAGPTPYQFLSAGLGACTSMTVRMYARRKGWPLEHVSVDISHDKIHATDCDECPDKNAKIDVFRRLIHLDGPLDADQRAKLMAIADHCPVHRTMEGIIKVETALAES